MLRLAPVRCSSLLARRFAASSNAAATEAPVDEIATNSTSSYSTAVSEPLYTPSFQTVSAAAAEASKRRAATIPPWVSSLPRPVATISPTYLHQSQPSHVAPTAREARKQLAALVQPERYSPAGRALGALGRGSNSTSLVRLTNYQLSVGRLTRLLTSNGNTTRSERALQNALLRLNKALQPIRVQHDAAAAAGSLNFEQWYAGRQQLTVVDQLERLLRLVSPFIELKSLRKSGKMYTVPIPIASESRRRSLVLRWLVEVIAAHPQNKLEDRILHELSELRTFRSPLYKKVAEVYGQAYANRSFTHFRV